MHEYQYALFSLSWLLISSLGLKTCISPTDRYSCKFQINGSKHTCDYKEMNNVLILKLVSKLAEFGRRNNNLANT